MWRSVHIATLPIVNGVLQPVSFRPSPYPVSNLPRAALWAWLTHYTSASSESFFKIRLLWWWWSMRLVITCWIEGFAKSGKLIRAIFILSHPATFVCFKGLRWKEVGLNSEVHYLIIKHNALLYVHEWNFSLSACPARLNTHASSRPIFLKVRH